jgi:hypothetical protein
MLAAGCSAGAPASYRASVGTCYAFGVQAIRRHVTVTAEPRACAGLSHEQINLAVARAVREAVGAEPKAAARHLADQYSGYLVHMLATVRPPGPRRAGRLARHRRGWCLPARGLAGGGRPTATAYQAD